MEIDSALGQFYDLLVYRCNTNLIETFRTPPENTWILDQFNNFIYGACLERADFGMSENGARRRIRSVSLSSDTECGRLGDVVDEEFPFLVSTMSKAYAAPVQSTACGKQLIRCDMSRALSSNCIDNCECSSLVSRHSLRVGNLTIGGLRFNQLPDECRLRVFSFLSILDRGFAAQVCRDWHRLMRDQTIWSNVDLLVFPVCSRNVLMPNLHECTLVCYVGYRHRLKRFLRYLIVIRPSISSLKFALDIGDPADGYNELLTALVKVSRWHELAMADLVWTETPAKGSFSRPQLNVTWSSNELRDLVHRRRYRQRQFVRFFDLFTAAAHNITELRIPFDWSERSINSLMRLTNLRHLTLIKYFRYSPVDPSAFHDLFSSLTSLQFVALELWTETGDGFAFYQIQSKSLRHLDIASCRGVYLSEMYLPSLKTFIVSRNPLGMELSDGSFWQGRYTDRPCIYDVLRTGAVQLLRLNDHVLEPDWGDNVYAELDQILRSVCSCYNHRPS